INLAGQIVGSSGLARIDSTPNDFPYHAFRYSSGTMTDLGVLPTGPESYATKINASGQIVGYSEVSGATSAHAFLYTGGSMVDLGTMGLIYSYAWGINASGQIVGEAGVGDGNPAGFLYSAGVMYDLNTLLDGSGAGWRMNEAYGINDNGWI